MSSPPVFPVLRGQGWSVTKTPRQSTTIASHVSGREVRVRNWTQTLYAFELTFDGLASDGQYPGLGRDSLQMLMALYNQCGGSFGTFLYTDPTDSFITGQELGVGDGATTSFRFQRAMFNFVEPVGWVSYVSAVYFNGVKQISAWNLVQPTAAVPYPNLTFTAAPAAGKVVSADFNWAFVCRFTDDTLDFEQFMSNLWQAKSVKFQSVRNSGL